MPETRKLQRPVSPTATNDAEPWHTQVACTKEDAPLFDYDPRAKRHDKGVIEAAKEICHSCPVIDSCILDALDYEAGKPLTERFEIRGALTPKERLKLDTTIGTKPKYRPKPKIAPPVRTRSTHCRLGLHELNDETTRYTAHGSRYCGPCDAARRRRNHAAAKAQELTA